MGTQNNHTSVERIGSRLELLLDDHLIETMDSVRFVLHKPTPNDIAIEHDMPWEGNISYYHTVFKDGDTYKMYYRGADTPGDNEDNIYGFAHPVVCYAESNDGIHWEKPNLGIVEFNGSKDNNIIVDWLRGHTIAAFKDPNPNCNPDESYKAIVKRYVEGKYAGGLYPLKSHDGINWSMMTETPVITKGTLDSQNLAFWDSEKKCYVAYHREMRKEPTSGSASNQGMINNISKDKKILTPEEAEDDRTEILDPDSWTGFRDIMISTSDDFINWTDSELLSYPGSPSEHLYTNQITQYHRAPHIYFGLPKRYVPEHNAPSNLTEPDTGSSDILFMSSRDGKDFKRWGEALIRPGPQKERWVNRNNLAAWGILETASRIPNTPNELSIYSIEGYKGTNGARMRRYTQRLDGFVSAQATLNGGVLTSKTISFEGKCLKINYSTSAAGSILTEIQDRNGRAIEGFELTNSVELFGDSVSQKVTWAGNPNLSKIEGKPIKLKFAMKDADLFSFKFHKD